MSAVFYLVQNELGEWRKPDKPNTEASREYWRMFEEEWFANSPEPSDSDKGELAHLCVELYAAAITRDNARTQEAIRGILGLVDKASYVANPGSSARPTTTEFIGSMAGGPHRMQLPSTVGPGYERMTPIEWLEPSYSLRAKLHRAGIHTLSQLMIYEPRELKHIAGVRFSDVEIKELSGKLREAGYAWELEGEERLHG